MKAQHAIYQQLLKENPQLYCAYYHLGNLYYDNCEWSQAATYYLQALAIKPDLVAAHHNLALVLQERGEWQRALHHCRCVLKVKPDAVDVYSNMGLAFRGVGDLEAALDAFAKALRIFPQHCAARWNRALTLLEYGDYKNGFAEYECRRVKEKEEEFFLWLKRKPEWQGENFGNKRLVIYDEQGYGDTIQFARYIPMVKARGGTVILITREPLIRLFATMPEMDGVIIRTAKGMAGEMFDYSIPLLSLPRIFGTTLESIPANISYLCADPMLQEACKAMFAPETLNIGLVWACSRDNLAEHKRRSVSLSLFAALGGLPGVAFYSLQKGEGVEQLANMPEGFTIIDLSEYITDFADTAAYIANLDLVITVDTAVAHLAGAMGKETWTLLPFSADWRWLRNREDSPWYPSMRLFRQPKPDDWQSIMQRVRSEILALLERR